MSSVLVVGGVLTGVRPIFPVPRVLFKAVEHYLRHRHAPGRTPTGSAPSQVGEYGYCSDPCQDEQHGQGGPVLSEVDVLVQGLLRPCCCLLDRWDPWLLQFRWYPGAGATASGGVVGVASSVGVGVGSGLGS